MQQSCSRREFGRSGCEEVPQCSEKDLQFDDKNMVAMMNQMRQMTMAMGGNNMMYGVPTLMMLMKAGYQAMMGNQANGGGAANLQIFGKRKLRLSEVVKQGPPLRARKRPRRHCKMQPMQMCQRL